MSPELVRETWPEEYELIDRLLRNYHDNYINVIKKQTSLNLNQTKRIILAIQNGLSLERFESENLPFVKEYIEELESQWNNLN